jgi:ribosomal protein S20
MKRTKAYRSFEGAADLAQHAARAGNYLKEVCAACAAGDRTAAQRALRQAISELETARAGLRLGSG